MCDLMCVVRLVRLLPPLCHAPPPCPLFVQGCVLLTRQVDQPGIVASISTLLANDSCNINFMTVGRTGKNMEAIMAIGIDQVGGCGGGGPGCCVSIDQVAPDEM